MSAGCVTAMSVPLFDQLPLPMRQFLGFCLVGGMGFVTELMIITLIKHLAPDLLFYARLLSFPPAMAVTYCLNRVFVFKSKAEVTREASLYSAGQIIGALLNLTLYMALLKFSFFFTSYPEAALAAGSAVGLLWNFGWAKHLTFRA